MAGMIGNVSVWPGELPQWCDSFGRGPRLRHYIGGPVLCTVSLPLRQLFGATLIKNNKDANSND
jgi:hypothetical protein